MKKFWIPGCIFGLLTACQPGQDRNSAEVEDIKEVVNTFGYDLNFLQNHLDGLIILKDDSAKSQVIVAPQYQGRVMTSTAGGEEGLSYGWINYDLISSGELREHMNPYGGEDRFWMGPEGGQYAIFFEQGDEFVYENWQTPPALDTEAFEVVSNSEKEVSFTKNISLQNYSGTRFDVKVDRTISLMDASVVENELEITLPSEGIDLVAFASDNRITNQGEKAWLKEEGLLSIWILGMFKPSPSTTVVIPCDDDPALDVPIVNDRYFGKVPEDRLKVENGFIYFKGDGNFRSKIGLAPERAKPIMGSYDAENKVLTIVKFSLPQNAADYVNSMWEIQNQPYTGDAINAYNDGPLDDGSAQLGPFYELESSSPAAALVAGESIQHRHITIHFSGSVETLDQLAREILGVGLEQINQVFS
ncbi:DUF6786 family protein [Catalinimonas niigatensis]|uniref:DUF6786 family protein n=1 Tax=Catalinimonas niigatensis TaxID=1397264 RepID=UPI0026655DF7|nr:DUF6786 family protein [Catalinimonas niigatensis]WPP50651.1 DUF6786 family protein [Catalinimonas niigatensis]